MKKVDEFELNKLRIDYNLKVAQLVSTTVLTIVIAGLTLINLQFPTWLFSLYLVAFFILFLALTKYVLASYEILQKYGKPKKKK